MTFTLRGGREFTRREAAPILTMVMREEFDSALLERALKDQSADDAFKALLESPKADAHSKKVAASALLYLVSRMDLIPDWTEGIGVIDDLMVLRVGAQLVQGHQHGDLSTTAEIALDRMANNFNLTESRRS